LLGPTFCHLSKGKQVKIPAPGQGLACGNATELREAGGGPGTSSLFFLTVSPDRFLNKITDQGVFTVWVLSGTLRCALWKSTCSPSARSPPNGAGLRQQHGDSCERRLGLTPRSSLSAPLGKAKTVDRINCRTPREREGALPRLAIGTPGGKG
jgi:hypothetical protein